MDLLVLHDRVALEVHDERPGAPRDLSGLLADLSFVRASVPPGPGPPLVVSARSSVRALAPPPDARVVMQADGLEAFESGRDVYVTDGSSRFHVKPRDGWALAELAPDFDARPLIQRHRFWAFGLLRLLRAQGLYGLHAAGIATPQGMNLLIAGPSGSGKSTLAVALVRCGGAYLSDDAVLLRAERDGVLALALRKPFSVDHARAAEYSDIVTAASSRSGPKRRADPARTYPDQRLSAFHPHALLFPRIVAAPASELRRIPRSVALAMLLAQSGPELFDRETMPAHLDVLARLLRHSTALELLAGRDLHQAPQGLIELLAQAIGPLTCPGSSSN